MPTGWQISTSIWKSNIVLPNGAYLPDGPDYPPAGGGLQYYDTDGSAIVSQEVVISQPGTLTASAWFSVRGQPRDPTNGQVQIVDALGNTIASTEVVFGSEPPEAWKQGVTTAIQVPAGTYTFQIALPDWTNVDLASLDFQPVTTVTLSTTSLGGTGPFSFSGDNGWGNEVITTTADGGPAVSGSTHTLTAADTATTITETIPPGYTITAVNCTGLGAGGIVTSNPAAGTIALDAAATAAGSTINCTVTNTFSPVVTLAKTSDAAEPATDGLATMSLSAASSTDTVVQYSIAGSAVPGTDYTALSGSVTIPAGQLSAPVAIPVIDNALVDGTRDVILTVTAVSSGAGTIGAAKQATVTIADNDAYLVTISNTSDSAEPATDGTLTVTQSGVSATDTVIAYTVAGTAIPGTDYTALSGTVIIPAGQTTATIIIPVIDNLTADGSRTVIITLTGVTSGSASLGATVEATNTITDDESANVSIINTTNSAEPATNGLFTVSQSMVSATDTAVRYTVTGTAIAGTDYTALSGTVTIPAGQTTATITVPVLDDTLVDGARTVIVTLTSVSSGNATLGATRVATNTIADNDSKPIVVTITKGSDGEEPSTNGSFVFTLAKPAATDTVITYRVSGSATAGADYEGLTGKLIIPAGQLSVVVPVVVLGDALLDGNETVTVTLLSVNGTAVTPPTAATLTIKDTTERVVRNALKAQTKTFMVRRLGLITSHAPEIFRLINREEGQFGEQQSKLAMTATPEATKGRWQINSRRVQNALAEPVADAPNTSESPWALWSEGEFSIFRDTRQDQNAKGDFFIGHAGVDYRVNPSLALGVMGELDVMNETFGASIGKTKGTGWMVGPYATAEIASHAFLDLRGLYGRSRNTAEQSIGGASYAGDFNTDRWLAEAVLRGNYQHEAWTLTPTAAVSFLSERQHMFEVQAAAGGASVLIPKQSAHLGQAKTGLKVAYAHDAGDWALSPYIAGDVMWDFSTAALAGTAAAASSADAFHGAMRLGLDATTDLTTIGLQLGYGGIGSDGFSDFSAKLGLLYQF